MKSRSDEIVLTLRPIPVGVDRLGRDVPYRLKLALKRLLRNYGFRCVRLAEGGRINKEGFEHA